MVSESNASWITTGRPVDASCSMRFSPRFETQIEGAGCRPLPELARAQDAEIVGIERARTVPDVPAELSMPIIVPGLDPSPSRLRDT